MLCYFLSSTRHLKKMIATKAVLLSTVSVFGADDLGPGWPGDGQIPTVVASPIRSLEEVRGLRSFIDDRFTLSVTPDNSQVLLQHLVFYESLFGSFRSGVHLEDWRSAQDVTPLAMILRSFNALRSLKISSEFPSVETYLRQCLQFNQTLERIDMSGCQLNKSQLFEIVASLVSSSLQHLTYLDLGRNALSTAQRHQLASRFPKAEILTDLGGLGRISILRVDGQDLDVAAIPYSQVEHYRRQAEESTGREGSIAGFITAYLYETGGDITQEMEAVRYYTNANIPEAFNNLAWMQENRKGGTTFDLSSIKQYYLRAKTDLEAEVNRGLINSAAIDKAAYNLLRYRAIYQNDIESMYALGNRYRNGIGIEADPEEALYWFCKWIEGKKIQSEQLESTDPNAAAKILNEIANIYSSGRFLPLDYVKSTQFMKRAAELGHPDAWLTLGECYERGIGVLQSYEKAVECYTKALASPMRAKEANKALGVLYEYGCKDIRADDQTRWKLDRDLQTAFSYYFKALELGSQTCLFNAARLSQDVSLTPQQIRVLQQRCLSPENESDGPIQFLLGTWYEQNHRHKLVKKDPKKARICYERAAKQRVSNAATRLRFMDHGFTLRGQELIPNYTRTLMDRAFKASEDVKDKVTRALEETPDIVAYEGAILHSSQEDFKTVYSYLEQEKERTKYNSRRLNYDYIWADPYLMSHKAAMQDLEPTIDTDLAVLRDSVLAALNNPDVTVLLPREELLRVFPELMQKIKVSANTPLLKSRLRRAYQLWVSGKVVHQTVSVEERKAKFAEFLYQNSNHATNGAVSLICNDGISGFLYDHFEKEFLKIPDSNDVGLCISKALLEYRRDVIQRHKNPLPGAEEEAREAIILLQYRLNHALGLGMQMDSPLHAQLGKGMDALYRPKEVIVRFFKGEAIQHTRGGVSVEHWIEPLTPDLCIQLVRAAFKDKAVLLQEQFIARDPYLRDFFERAFVDMRSNEYFDPTAYDAKDQSKIYTDKFFEYLCLAYGYLLPKAE